VRDPRSQNRDLHPTDHQEGTHLSVGTLDLGLPAEARDIARWGYPAPRLEWILALAAAAAATAAAEASCSGEGVFAATIVAGIAYVALAITGFVGVEVIESLLSTTGDWAIVAIVRVKAVIDVAMKAVGTVEPGTGSDEYSAEKPVWAIVAVGGAVIGCVVKVAVGAIGGYSNVDADANLGRGCRGFGGCTEQR